MGWAILVFWSTDLLLTFFVGYYTKTGAIVLDMIQVAKHYATTWLIFDLVLVILDWVSIGLKARTSTDASLPSVGKSLRTLRILRMLRLLRLFKLQGMVGQLQDLFLSDI